ncbi:MAG: LysR family transcriptional regulator [Firmicutes bacterium]|nr:LysR family transcriptional regulator [Bacillota bacterium]
MKMAQIEAFYAVINAGSISQAARLSHISQPAVSMQIRELEEYCQLPLLIRTNKGVTPTAAGLVVYQYCQKIISLKKDLANELANLKKQLDKFPELIT